MQPPDDAARAAAASTPPADLADVRRAVEEALRRAERTPAKESPPEFEALWNVVLAASTEIDRAVTTRAVASVELRAIETAFTARWMVLPTRPLKLLYRLHESLIGGIERLTFHERAHEQKDARCGCALWRDIAGGGPLSTRPDLVDPLLLEQVKNSYQSYRRHACRSCGSVWTEDDNPDSDPSSVTWSPG